MTFYYLIFLIIASFSFVEGKPGSRFYIFSGLLLFSIAALRAEGVDRDYQGYIEYYNDVLNAGFENVEPSFIFIVRMVDGFFGSITYLFVVYALLGVFIKLYAIDKLTSQKNLALLVYYSGFFLLLELTQIRAGVAAGFFLLCIKPIRDRNYKKFLIFAALAFCFHYSAIVIFPLYFVGNRQPALAKYALLPPLALLLYYFDFDIFHILQYIKVDLINLKIRNYQEHAFMDPENNVFNVIFLFRCLIAYILLWHVAELARKNRYFITLLKIQFIGIFIFLAFANVPGISSRASELLFVVEIILIPTLIYIVQEKKVAHCMVVAASLASLSFFLLHSELIGPYF